MRRFESPGSGMAVILLALGAALAVAAGCGKGEPPGPAVRGKPPVPVLVAVAGQADVPVEVRALGAVEPFQSSPVRSQLTGIITGVRLHEGDMVRAGQVLFTTDRRPIEATLRQLEANLARDEAQARSAEAQVRNAEAQLRNAETQAARYEDLVGKQLVAREQYDQRATNRDAARAALDASRAAAEAGRAAVQATQAALENARLQLDYTSIVSPVSGQAGSLLVDRGDLVKANDATLVTVNQVQPILVRFAVPEPRLPEVQKYRKAGALKVRLSLPGPEAKTREGRLVFLDNAVDGSTGTIALKAEFDNADHALWPGQFAEVALLLTTREKAVVVPAAAVQTGQKGPYVFVVEPGGTAAVRPVTPGPTAGGRTIIEQGLAAGETVVTDGQLRLTPGAPVAVKTGLEKPR